MWAGLAHMSEDWRGLGAGLGRPRGRTRVMKLSTRPPSSIRLAQSWPGDDGRRAERPCGAQNTGFGKKALQEGPLSGRLSPGITG